MSSTQEARALALTEARKNAKTVEAAKEQHDGAIEFNQDLGVVQYRSNEPLSEAVYEVTQGKKFLPGGITLGPGQRFHPTERQVRNGSLKNKAREITRSEYSGLRERRVMATGVDFNEMGLKALGLTGHALRAALEAGLTTDDFEGVEGQGAEGSITKAQVNEIVAARQQAV